MGKLMLNGINYTGGGGGGSGDLTAVELTKAQYDALTQAQKEDTTKLYMVTDYSPGGGGGDLEDLGDVNITSPTNGQVLSYDSASQKWINAAGGGGSDEPQKIDMFDGASTITPTASNGITVSTSSVSNMVGAISGSEWSNGYEGFNIAVKNLSIGKDYILRFDWKFTNTAYFVGQYVVGFKLFTTNKSNYDDWRKWDENLDRDDLIHSHKLSFQATATTMYLCFNLCGCSDGQVNYWDISNLYLLELPSGGGTEYPHEIVRQRNVYCADGTSITLNLTKKYANPYVMPCNIVPLSSWGGLVVIQDTSAINYDSSNDTVTFLVYTNGAQNFNIDWNVFEESS